MVSAGIPEMHVRMTTRGSWMSPLIRREEGQMMAPEPPIHGGIDRQQPTGYRRCKGGRQLAREH